MRAYWEALRCCEPGEAYNIGGTTTMTVAEFLEKLVSLSKTKIPLRADPALLRPGRFDRRVVLDRPDMKGREKILQVHVRGKPLGGDVDLTALARQTPGFVGADIENMVNEAAILAARRGRSVSAHDPAPPDRSQPDLRRHLGGGGLPQRGFGRDVAADQPGPGFRRDSRSDRRGGPLRAPHGDAPVASRRAVHAKALGRVSER